ncbi:MAG: PTS sugar transporter subunit IIB [Lachnospiraceae bacterium]|jgi:mannose/fructose/N-acetylgalactosamine-specific phosphotransferase system component IIB|nr:PTS sugar transporter subunit IIB [Lachnospiraceae bacterium]
MIKLLRLDDRMIHGQISTKWSRVLSVDRIIVINDDAAANELVKRSLMMAAPATCKVAIKSVRDSVELLKNPKAKEHDILLIVANPADLLTVVNQVEGIQKVNIGNFGLLEKSGNVKRKRYNEYFWYSEDEAEIYRQIVEKGLECTIQVIPDDVPSPLSNILKKEKGS